jgi:hypothetical protein
MSRVKTGKREAGVAIVAGLYLAAMGVEPTSHTDTARDILLARDGLATGVFEGCDASYGGFRQGALWVRLLAFSHGLGLGPVAQHAFISIWLIAGVVLFDRLVRTQFGAHVGSTSTAMFLPLIVLAIGYPNLWNPTIASLAVVLLTWALLEVVTRGSLGAAWASGAGLALAAEASWSAFLIGPVVAVAVLVSCSRPLLASGFAILGALVPSLSWSYTTWKFNSAAIVREPWHLPFLATATAALIGLALGARRRWRRLAVERRRTTLLAFLVGTMLLLALSASILARRLLISPQYLFTALPAAVILLALGLRRLRGGDAAAWRVALAIGLPLLVFSIPLAASAAWRHGLAAGEASIPTYSMREASILARHFYESGFSFSDLQRSVRGPDGIDLMYAMAAYAPDPAETAARPLADQRVLAFSEAKRPAELPAGGREIDLGRGRRAWILPIEAWIHLAPSNVCFLSASGEPARECAEIASPTVPLGGRFRDLAFPSFAGIHEAQRRFAGSSAGRPVRVRWELPIALAGADVERHVQLASIFSPPWRIVRVEGVGYRGDLPARRVVIDRSGGTVGRLVVSADAVPQREYPPEIIETSPGENEIRRALNTLPPLGPSVCAALETCP